MNVRPAGPDELEEVFRAMSGPFGFDMPEEEELTGWLERAGRMFEPDRARLAEEDGAIVGTLLTLSLGMSVPGTVLPMAGTTGVTVRTSHRRRGALRMMMAAHLADAAEREEPAATLWASDSAIYGRFGYGMAAWSTEIEVPRDHIAFHRLATEPSRVTEVGAEEVAGPAKSVYGAMLGSVPGFVDRSDAWWETRTLSDRPNQRGGAGKARYAVAWEGADPVGWAKFRIKDGSWDTGHADQEVRVVQCFATTPSGWAGMWNYLLSHDFAGKIKAFERAVDDPITSLLGGIRRARVRRSDGLWIRPLDVAALLEGRSWIRTGAVDIAVEDAAGYANGRYRLEVEDGSARVTPTQDAQVTLDVEDLGALSLGGRSATELALAGRIDGSPDEIRSLDALFRWDRAPWCPEIF